MEEGKSWIVVAQIEQFSVASRVRGLRTVRGVSAHSGEEDCLQGLGAVGDFGDSFSTEFSLPAGEEGFLDGSFGQGILSESE